LGCQAELPDLVLKPELDDKPGLGGVFRPDSDNLFDAYVSPLIHEDHPLLQ
jgi:hypothetical protein